MKCQENEALQNRLKSHYDNVGKNSVLVWGEFDETQLMMCPPRVAGYALHTKMWVRLHVDSLKLIPHQQDKTAWDKLVLPEDDEHKDIKELIRQLVQYHAWKDSNKKIGVPEPLKDLVEGKGQGLVILLHGKN